MKLYELKKSKGLKNKAPRKGRGNASKGNTCGKGHKGQKARTGGSIRLFFEGGQTPLVQRIPKMKGFKRYFKHIEDWAIVNIENLEADTRVTKLVNKEVLLNCGYRKKHDKVKVLGTGEMTKALSFEGIDKFSETAQEKIEKAGGTIK